MCAQKNQFVHVFSDGKMSTENITTEFHEKYLQDEQNMFVVWSSLETIELTFECAFEQSNIDREKGWVRKYWWK